MARPRVAVVTRRMLRKGKWVDFLGEYHSEFLIRHGALPVIVPVAEGAHRCLAEWTGEMAGLLLVEGEDVTAPPEAQPLAGETHPYKDEIEIGLCRAALERGMPVLGICRGSHLLNLVSGGTLHADVTHERRSSVRHIAEGEEYDRYRHPITILSETPLHRWYGETRIDVNSYHHQGVRELAPRFRPMAHTDDGLVEAFYDPEARFVVGLQFHPERTLDEHAGHARVLRAFVDAVKRRAKAPPLPHGGHAASRSRRRPAARAA